MVVGGRAIVHFSTSLSMGPSNYETVGKQQKRKGNAPKMHFENLWDYVGNVTLKDILKFT